MATFTFFIDECISAIYSSVAGNSNMMKFPGINQAGAYLAHSSVSATERTSE